MVAVVLRKYENCSHRKIDVESAVQPKSTVTALAGLS